MKKFKSTTLLFLLSSTIFFVIVLLYLLAFGKKILQHTFPIDIESLLWINYHHNSFWGGILYLASDTLFYLLVIHLLYGAFGTKSLAGASCHNPHNKMCTSCFISHRSGKKEKITLLDLVADPRGLPNLNSCSIEGELGDMASFSGIYTF